MENQYSVVGLTDDNIDRWELTADKQCELDVEQIHRNKESIRCAIIYNKQAEVMLCLADRSNATDFANAMNYAVFCGLPEHKNLTVDQVRYSVFDMGQNYKLTCVNHQYSTVCSSTNKDTSADVDDIYLRDLCPYDWSVDGAVVNVRYRIVDTKDSEYSACYFESYEVAMNFANAMNFAYLSNKYIFRAREELVFN